MGYIVGIDTGGTFTDGVVVNLQTSQWIKLKVLTTPYDLTECFLDLLKLAAENLGLDFSSFLSDCEEIRYSQTIATNTIITRTGTKLGLIVTNGYQDSLYNKEHLGDSSALAFVNKDMIVGLDEEIEGGEIVEPLCEEDALSAMETLVDKGARSIVIALKNSYVNPLHEKAVHRIIRKEYPPQYLGRVQTFLSHEVAKVRDDYVRTLSTIVDGYIHSKMATYMYRAEDMVRARNFRGALVLVNSDGSLSTIPRTKALSTIGSGPSAGVIGANVLSRKLYGPSDAITFDIGGTSLDIGHVRRGEQQKISYYFVIEGCKIFQPMINVKSIAIGGGSIVRVVDGSVRVGPDSVGSFPGPACFDRGGTEITPTDADLVLGYLDPKNFHGGKIALNYSKAMEIMVEKIGSPLGIDPISASQMVRKAMQKSLVDSIRAFVEENKVEGGISAYCYGGGGPLHACAVLSAIPEIDNIRIFPFSSEFSAMGCCMLDDSRHAYKEFTLDEFSSIEEMISELKERMEIDLRSEGITPIEASMNLGIFFDNGSSYIKIGKSKEDSSLLANLQGAEGPLILSLNYTIPSKKPIFANSTLKSHETPQVGLKGKRNACWGSESAETNVYALERLKFGNMVKGPAIIEAEDSTIVVEPQFSYTIDEYGNGLLKRAR